MAEVATQKLIGEMDDAEFNALIERFIERDTQSTGEVLVDVLFEALPDFFAAAESAQHLEVDGELRGDRLVLSVPDELPTQIQKVEVRFPTMRVVGVRFRRRGERDEKCKGNVVKEIIPRQRVSSGKIWKIWRYQ